MTPFVDIILVILIIFLISATVMLPRMFAIALPKAAQADRLENAPVIISIDREGAIAINGVRLSQDADFDRVFHEQGHSSATQAIIAADKEVRHGRLIEVIDKLRHLKVQRLGIEVEQQ